MAYLVKAVACDPKELAETSDGVRKVSLDPIVSQDRSFPVHPEIGLVIGPVLFVQKTLSAGGGLWAPLSCVGRPSVGSQVVLGGGHTRASLGTNWSGVRPGFPTQHTQARAC
jgi:hypothetical protein